MGRKLLISNQIKPQEKQMLRTFHIKNGNKHVTQHHAEGGDGKQLNVSECNNGKKVILGIDTGEQYVQIELNYQQYHELCDLQYSLDLSEDEPEESPQQLIESDQHRLKAA